MQLTPHHALYYAHDLTRRSNGSIDRLSMALFDAAVDLNPHQIEAALFALKSPLSQGVLLADEVGLGKTIEAGIILCQYWAERRRRLLVICPASIRKQWALELEEKFNLPAFILDSRSHAESLRAARDPLEAKAVVIVSYNYANSVRERIKAVPWDLVVIDEAHKLRNAYRQSNVVGQGIRQATAGRKKLLLTATPLQNSLLELYGLSTLIDEDLFGGVDAFRANFMGQGASLDALRGRLSAFCKRSLRRQVVEYVRYTDRHAITRPFRPTDDEHALYEAVSELIQRPKSYSMPRSQRHLIQLILRKLLSSSSAAIADTLETMKKRLEELRRKDEVSDDDASPSWLGAAEDLDDDLLDELLEEKGEAEQEDEEGRIDKKALEAEIEELGRLMSWARSIGTDTKARALLAALELGFGRMSELGAERKALVFTESRRTQDYLYAFLEENGYRGKLVLFNGSNGGPEATGIYERWLSRNRETGRASGSRDVDARTAIVEAFRDDAEIMIATEAASEGVNLQFCSLVVNYDLPWNPQRVEQRIGRCHRYGQKHDVVVVNFLNERNEADRRVLELLTEKFRLFDGVFGASDEILGTVESGLDFERRILAIYQECRTEEAIEAAFRKLQSELDERIRTRMDDARASLFENFDEDVHERLRLELDDARARLDRFGKRFWALSRFMLEDRARFDEASLSFDLRDPPRSDIRAGRYHLITKSGSGDRGLGDEGRGSSLYRLSHPLGEHVIAAAKGLEAPVVRIAFDISSHPSRIAMVEALKGRSGWLSLALLAVDSFEHEDWLLFSGFDAEGHSLDQESCEKLFNCSGRVEGPASPSREERDRLDEELKRHAQAQISSSLEENSLHFREAREKLELWAEDVVAGAERALRDTKERIKALEREARQAPTLEEQKRIQEELRRLELKKRKQRQEIFRVEDEAIERRDELIGRLERRLSQRTELRPLFSIAWSVR